jgi:hypothetical protein
MKTHEQIEALEDRIRKDTISDEEILREVHALFFAFDDADYQEKSGTRMTGPTSISTPANRTRSAVATWFDLICCRSLD